MNHRFFLTRNWIKLNTLWKRVKSNLDARKIEKRKICWFYLQKFLLLCKHIHSLGFKIRFCAHSHSHSQTQNLIQFKSLFSLLLIRLQLHVLQIMTLSLNCCRLNVFFLPFHENINASVVFSHAFNSIGVLIRMFLFNSHWVRVQLYMFCCFDAIVSMSQWNQFYHS